MINILMLVFIMTLFVCSTATRLKTYIKVLIIQGLLLFCFFLIRLNEINITNLVLLLVETIVIKSIAIPYFLEYLIKKNKITREAEPYISYFSSIFIFTLINIFIFFLANTLRGGIFQNIFLVGSVSTFFTGFYLMILRHKIITHVIGFIILENGVVILSLAVGNEMPMLVNLGILLDIFVTVLVLGIFANKLGDVFKDGEVDQLIQLKD